MRVVCQARFNASQRPDSVRWEQETLGSVLFFLLSFVWGQRNTVTCTVEPAGALPLSSQHLYCLGNDCAACRLAAGREMEMRRWISQRNWAVHLMYQLNKCDNKCTINIFLMTHNYSSLFTQPPKQPLENLMLFAVKCWFHSNPQIQRHQWELY